MNLKNNNNLTLINAVNIVYNELKSHNTESARLDSELLVMYVTGFSKIALITNNSYILTDNEAALLEKLTERRLNHEPMAYILGSREFMGLDFNVTPDTLIPRPDTEVLVEEIVKISAENKFSSFLDIGTGSGAIAVSVCHLVKDAVFDACDISKGALKTASLNAEKNKVSKRITFIESDLFTNIPKKQYDVIVSNPPYIESDVILTLESDVKDFEPITALDGGKDGLDFYRKIISDAPKYMKNGSMLFFEIGYNQAQSVKALMLEQGFNDIVILKDLAGLNRVVYGRLDKL